jgi:hypothetical protein
MTRDTKLLQFISRRFSKGEVRLDVVQPSIPPRYQNQITQSPGIPPSHYYGSEKFSRGNLVTQGSESSAVAQEIDQSFSGDASNLNESSRELPPSTVSHSNQSVFQRRSETAFAHLELSPSKEKSGVDALFPLALDGIPEMGIYLAQHFTREGDSIIDINDCSGTFSQVPLSLKRYIECPNQHVLLQYASRIRYRPIDLALCTLFLQKVPPQVPIALEQFSPFSPFYEITTYQELVAVRSRLLNERRTALTEFLQASMLGILHGPSAGFLSVPTSSLFSPSALQQDKLNISRNHYPAYRSVLPRLLKRIASITQEYRPSQFLDAHTPGIIGTPYRRVIQKASLLHYFLSYPGFSSSLDSQHLRMWFLGIHLRDERSEAAGERWIERAGAVLDSYASRRNKETRIAYTFPPHPLVDEFIDMLLREVKSRCLFPIEVISFRKPHGKTRVTHKNMKEGLFHTVVLGTR